MLITVLYLWHRELNLRIYPQHNIVSIIMVVKLTVKARVVDGTSTRQLC